jgi:hypothetical protein
MQHRILAEAANAMFWTVEFCGTVQLEPGEIQSSILSVRPPVAARPMLTSASQTTLK